MSTDFDIECATCQRAGVRWVDRSTNLDNVRDPESLQALVNIAPAMTVVGKAITAPKFWIGVLDMEMLYCIARFFAEHDGHALEVHDEYGHLWAPVQTYDNGTKVGEPKMCRIEETIPRASARITMP